LGKQTSICQSSFRPAGYFIQDCHRIFSILKEEEKSFLLVSNSGASNVFEDFSFRKNGVSEKCISD
jgi:hypothetical protein